MTTLLQSRVNLIYDMRDVVDTAMIEGQEHVTIDTYDLLALIAPDLARMRNEPTEGDTTELDIVAIQCEEETQPVKGQG